MASGAASLPGHVGMPVVGDKSVEFYRDAIGFVNSRIEKHDGIRLFQTRFLNKPTAFVASNQGVQDLMNDADSCFEMGYKQFMAEIYGDNVLFQDGEDAQHLRTTLQQLLLSNDSFKQFSSIVENLTTSTFQNLDTTKPVQVYKLFKRLATQICLTLFLDIDFETSSELAAEVVSLTTTHWHGIISLPFNLRLPGMNSRSTYGHAIEAKASLLKIIEEKLEKDAGFPHKVKESALQEKAANHVLLFTSALVPKALASLLTSFVVHTANKKSMLEDARQNPDKLENILLELQRMWPPFAGGRRIAKKETTIDGHVIPAGYSVVFMTQHAQRDPAVFADPDSLMPSRWSAANKDDRDKLLLFGAGPRCCIGQHLVWHILKSVSQLMLETYNWDISPGHSLLYKWLPVSRPKENLTVLLRYRDSAKHTQKMEAQKTEAQKAEAQKTEAQKSEAQKIEAQRRNSAASVPSDESLF